MAEGPFNPASPDGVAALALSMGGSLVVALSERVSGWSVLATSIGAAVLTGAVAPVAIHRGYTWSDWLGVIYVLCGLFSGTVFGLAVIVKQRWLARGNEAADGLWALTIGRFLKKKEGQ